MFAIIMRIRLRPILLAALANVPVDTIANKVQGMITKVID